VGIASASSDPIGAGAKLGRASTRIAAAGRPGTTCIASGMGRPCGAGGTGNTAGTGMGATLGAGCECTSSASRCARSVMDRAAARRRVAGRSVNVGRPLGAVLESARPSLGRTQAGGIDTACPCHQHLGFSAAYARGAAADRRTVMERGPRALVGCAEDRRACRPRGTLMVGPGFSSG
jgi:hypothetical protein